MCERSKTETHHGLNSLLYTFFFSHYLITDEDKVFAGVIISRRYQHYLIMISCGGLLRRKTRLQIIAESKSLPRTRFRASLMISSLIHGIRARGRGWGGLGVAGCEDGDSGYG